MASVIGSAILRTQSDERLVALARGGHQRAFEAIAERYRAELTRSLRRLMPGGSVEDALQQTHLQAWKALSGGTEVRELRAWLHRIARNAAIAVASRGYDYDELHDALLVTPGPEHELERREAVRRALRGIAELPERQREALLAVAVGGRSHAEVGLELGITDTAARQLVHRARVSLLAAASILTPPQLVRWAAQAGHSMVAGKAVAGTGTGIGGSLAGPALKLGAVAVTVGGVAAGVGPIRHALVTPAPAPHHQRHVHHARPSIYQTAALNLRVTAHHPTGSAGPRTTIGPAPAAPAARHSSHRVRLVRPDAIGKTVAPGAAAVPNPAAAAAPAPSPAASTPSAPNPTASTPAAASAATASPVAVLLAWWYAHHQPGASPAGGPGPGSSGSTATDKCPAAGTTPPAGKDGSAAGSSGCPATRSGSSWSTPGGTPWGQPAQDRSGTRPGA